MANHWIYYDADLKAQPWQRRTPRHHPAFLPLAGQGDGPKFQLH
jgi:hypothetical protein